MKSFFSEWLMLVRPLKPLKPDLHTPIFSVDYLKVSGEAQAIIMLGLNAIILLPVFEKSQTVYRFWSDSKLDFLGDFKTLHRPTISACRRRV